MVFWDIIGESELGIGLFGLGGLEESLNGIGGICLIDVCLWRSCLFCDCFVCFVGLVFCRVFEFFYDCYYGCVIVVGIVCGRGGLWSGIFGCL